MLQGALFPPDSSWKPPRLSDLPQDWGLFPRIGLDTETCDPRLRTLGPGVRRGGWVAGVSFATSATRGWYLPLRHLGGDNVEDPARALAYLRDQAARYTGEVVGAKVSYDLDFLAEAGVEFPLATIKDVQVAEPLLDELQYSYSLDSILGRHGMELKDEELMRRAAAEFGIPVKDVKASIHKMPARYVGPYAEADACRPLELMERQERELGAQGLGRVWALECAVLPVLVRMRRRGVRVSFDQLDRVERFSLAEEALAWGELQRLTGVAVKVGDGMKAEVVARALEAVGIRTPKTATGKPSLVAAWLEALDHPAGRIIRRARKMSQLRTTFVASVRDHAIGDRIHCTFNQTVMQKEDGSAETEGAAFGRLSCQDPNLQNQPARDPELGPMWRRVYVPDEGGEWASCDYSQQEPGLALHFALASGEYRIGRAAMLSAQAAAERKRSDPSMDYHTMFTAMVHGDHVLGMDKKSKELKLLRDPAKNIYLGICYGMGGPKLCRQLKLPTKVIEDRRGRRREVAGDEGQALLDLVDRRVPYIRKTAEAVEKAARERGFVVTIMGRRCRFPRDEHGNLEDTHKAFNRIIQGGAADQTKQAMVDLDRAGCPLALQVHDEVDMTIGSRAEGDRWARIMQECMPLSVPIKVDVEVGPSWGEIA